MSFIMTLNGWMVNGDSLGCLGSKGGVLSLSCLLGLLLMDPLLYEPDDDLLEDALRLLDGDIEEVIAKDRHRCPAEIGQNVFVLFILRKLYLKTP